MRHLLLSSTTTTTTTTTMPLYTNNTTTTTTTTNNNNNNNHNHHSSSSSSTTSTTNSVLCKHSPSATLDLLILILVLFSGTFLLTSYLCYIFHSLSLLFSHSTTHSLLLFLNLNNFNNNFNNFLSLPYIFGFLLSFAVAILVFEFCCGARSRKCDNPGCKGMKKAMEFDLQLQTEECVRSGSNKEIDRLPWKGGSEGNPDYECLRAELRKMAPPNGRAVLLFRARCGCPVAKLEGWGPKRGRRHKKALANVAVNGDHR